MDEMTDKPEPDTPKRKERPLTIIGWMERVSLPDLDLFGVKAKIDTGARTSALHVSEIEHFEQNGEPWVRFLTLDTDGQGDHYATAKIHSDRWIKNTSGIPEERIIIRTRARFGTRTWTIDLSLSDRTNMTFPMIVGRSALKNHAIAGHTRRAYLISEK